MNPKSPPLNYDLENDKNYYDIVINIESLSGLADGYEVDFTEQGWEHYKNKMNNKCCVVGVVGNRNKGKSYLLYKLSGIEIPVGHTITTKGLSVNFPKEEKAKAGIVMIDTAGLETPLLFDEDPKVKLKGKRIISEEKMNLIARDKQLTELFLQKFVIAKSNILLAVVGALTLSDQKLLHRITNEWKNGKPGRLFIVHNLMNYEKISQVTTYIEEILKQSYTFQLDEMETFSLPSVTSDEVEVDEKKMTIYQEKIKNNNNDDDPIIIIHVIMAQENTEAGNHYNESVLKYIKKQIESNLNNHEFPLLEEMKKFLVSQGKVFFESPKLEEKDIEVRDRRIKLLKEEKIVLKRCIVDELGVSSLYSSTFTPKYKCYINKDKLVFEVDIHEKINNFKSSVNTSENGNDFFMRGNKQQILPQKDTNEDDEIEIVHDSIEFGEFNIEINIPKERVLLSSHKFKLLRDAEQKLLIIYDILDNNIEQIYNYA